MTGCILKDKDVRDVLHKEVLSRYENDPTTLIIDELGLLQGLCRVDIAVINGIMHGYEIKSDADTLDRLPTQAELYNKVLDKLTLVVGEKHLNSAEGIIPKWWGIKVVSKIKGETKIFTHRKEKNNKDVDALSVAELLWKQEVVDILIKKGYEKRIFKHPKEILYNLLVEECSLQEIKDITRTILKSRINWRDR